MIFKYKSTGSHSQKATGHSKTMSLLAQQINLICIHLLFLNSEMRLHKLGPKQGQINFLFAPMYSQKHKNTDDLLSTVAKMWKFFIL